MLYTLRTEESEASVVRLTEAPSDRSFDTSVSFVEASVAAPALSWAERAASFTWAIVRSWLKVVVVVPGSNSVSSASESEAALPVDGVLEPPLGMVAPPSARAAVAPPPRTSEPARTAANAPLIQRHLVPPEPLGKLLRVVSWRSMMGFPSRRARSAPRIQDVSHGLPPFSKARYRSLKACTSSRSMRPAQSLCTQGFPAEKRSPAGMRWAPSQSDCSVLRTPAT